MFDATKTIFISYRRTPSRYLARAIFEHLQGNGYDVFLDIENIDSGEFERIILGQIAARQHFLVLLTVGTMERCSEPSDWLRREIEYAINVQRNIVPIMVDEFSFADVKQYLTGDLSNLEKYNAFKLYYDYFDEGMLRLRERFLRQPFEGELKPIAPSDIQTVERKLAEISAEPIPTPTQLSAEEYFNRAKKKFLEKDFSGSIENLTQAINLNSYYTTAYINRGTAHKRLKNIGAALNDFTAAINLDPGRATTFYNRGRVYLSVGEIEKAILDFTKAIEINENFSDAFKFRSKAYKAIGDNKNAEADKAKENEIKEDFSFDDFDSFDDFNFSEDEFLLTPEEELELIDASRKEFVIFTSFIALLSVIGELITVIILNNATGFATFVRDFVVLINVMMIIFSGLVLILSSFFWNKLREWEKNLVHFLQES